ncbi:MAG: Rne/Rng family ribonuclease, partial [Paraclostridium sp.]
MKNVVIESLVVSQKTAVLEDGKLVELLVEDMSSSKTVSNIYRGVVKKTLKGMEAFFVDFGSEKLGYLPMKNNTTIKCGNDIL